MVSNSSLPALQPQRIKEGRLFRGLTQGDLSEALGITKQAVSQYETGVMTPTMEMLNRMTEILDFPLAYFSKPYSNDILTPVFFRKKKTSKKKIMLVFETYIKWMTDIYTYIEEYIHLPQLNLITHDKVGYTDKEISDIAMELRRYWGLGEGPISNLTLLLENNGIIISKVGLDYKKVDACSLFFTSPDVQKRPMIFLTSGTSAVRYRRDIAHELGHQVLHSWMDEESKADNEELIEREAELFASYFLMPEHAMKREAYAVSSASSLLVMKERWGTSAQSIFFHLQNIGAIDYDFAEKLKRSIYSRGWRVNEPGDDKIVQEKPELIKDSIMLMVEHNIKSPLGLIDDLLMPSDDITELCGLEKDFFNVSISKKPCLKLVK